MTQLAWKKIGIYISIILDALGRVVGVYIGSGTGINGVAGRWWSYETALKRGFASKAERSSSHIAEALKPGHTWHIRPLLLADRDEISTARTIALEGLFTDLCNTMFVGFPSTNPHRSQAVIDAYLEAVPEDMLNAPWKRPNRAHQLKQGARRSSKIPCAVEICPYGDGKSTCLTGHIEGRLIYVCGRGCYSHMTYRDVYENAR